MKFFNLRQFNSKRLNSKRFNSKRLNVRPIGIKPIYLKKLKFFSLLIVMAAILLYEHDNSKNTEPVSSSYESNTEQGSLAVQNYGDSIAISSTENGTEENTINIEETRTKISIIMVGDVLLHTKVNDSCKKNGTYNYSSIFQNVKNDIASADIAIANQEVILGGSELGITGYPSFNGPHEMADSLADSGFDVICQGTNHALDAGKKGILNCLDYWESNYPDIEVLGIHDSQEDQNNISIYESKGYKIALLNYTYGTNGISLPYDMPYAVDTLDETKVISDIKKAKELADFVIVFPHWGTEYNHDIDSMQEKWTQIFLDNEIDLVIGTHPHVIEPVKMLTGKNNHKMLVYYSIGNFVNWTSQSGSGVADRMLGGMAQITLTTDSNDELQIDSYGVKALISHVSSKYGKLSVYPLSDYTDSLALENEIINQDSNFSIDYETNLCDTIWGDLWK